MLVKIIIIVFAVFISSVQSDIPISVDEYNALPPIFHLDSDEKCYEEGKYYCSVKVNLEPNDTESPSKAWKNIQALNNLTNYYSHHELLHAVCFDDFCNEFQRNYTTRDFNKTLTRCYSKKYEEMGLKASIVRFNCKNSRKHYDVNPNDVLLLVVLISYINFVMFATFYEYSLNSSKHQENKIKMEGNKYILCFSLLKNWNRIKRSSQASNTQIMTYIQGIRFYNTTSIIICHTILSYFLTYIDNPNYIEEIDYHPIKLLLKNTFVFLVQPFFLLSAFFLTYNTLQKLGHLKRLTVKHLLIILLNRYLRLIPPLSIAITLTGSVWLAKFLFFGPINEIFCNFDLDYCRKNWWTNLLLINNQYDTKNMCYLLSWYLAADFQLYAFSLVLLALIWKYENHVKLILFIPFISGVVLRFITNYIYNLQVIFRLFPDRLKDNSFRDHEMEHSYMFTYLQLPTYMIGIYTGYIYYYQRRIFNNFLMRIIFWISAFGLPSIVLLLATGHNYSKITTAFIASILNPMFSLGIAILILGIRENLAQYVKRILELRVAVIFANFSYSTYVIQYNIIIKRMCSQVKLAFVSDIVIIMSGIRDILLSFTFGFIVYIMVEMPAFNLQKLLVPQVEDLDRVLEKKGN